MIDASLFYLRSVQGFQFETCIRNVAEQNQIRTDELRFSTNYTSVTLAGDLILQVQWFLFYFTFLFLHLDICQTLSQFVISHTKLLIVIKNEGQLSQPICLWKL